MAGTRTYRLLEEIISEIETSVGTSENVFGKPKAPPTPLMMYSNENLDRVKEENPGLKNAQISKLIQGEFKELSTKKLGKMVEKHKELHVQYLKQLKVYNKQYSKGRQFNTKPVTPVELFIVDKREEGTELSKIELKNEFNQLPMEQKIPYIRKSFSYQQVDKDSKYISLKEVERIKEHYGKPKNYATPFAYFCNENYSLIEDLGFGQKSKFLGKMWKELSPKKKDELQQRFVKYRKDYEDLYAEYLNRLPIELIKLTENLSALRDTPYNLFLKDVRSKDPSANVKDQWENLSRTKRVKWILKSFEKQESAKKSDYKKLITNDEMAIIVKTLDKPASHQSAYSMYRTIYDKSVSEGQTPVKWNNLSSQERNVHKQNFIEDKKVFVEQFVQYLLRLPHICRKPEIINTKHLTENDKREICLLLNQLSEDKIILTEILKDDETDEEEVEDEKVKKTDKSSKAKKRSLQPDEKESMNQSKSNKKNNSIQIDEPKVKKSKKNESIVEEPIVEEKKTKKSKKDKSNVSNVSIEEDSKVNISKVDETIEDEMNASKKRKRNKKDVSVKEKETPVEEVIKVEKKVKKNKKEVLPSVLPAPKEKILEPEIPPT